MRIDVCQDPRKRRNLSSSYLELEPKIVEN